MPQSKDTEGQTLGLQRMKIKLIESEKAKRKADSLLKEALKIQQSNMDRTSNLVTSLPASQDGVTQERILQLTQLIDATVSTEEKWIYTAEITEWPKHLTTEEGKPWSSKDSIHPTVKMLLQSSTIPLWAANKEASKNLGKAMTAFQTLEFVESDITGFINSSPQQEDDIKQFLKIAA